MKSVEFIVKVAMIIGALFLTLFQKLIVDEIVVFNGRADIMVVFLVLILASLGSLSTMALGFFIGLFYDMLVGVMGVHALINTLVVLFSVLMIYRLRSYNLMRLLVILFFLGIFSSFIEAMFYNASVLSNLQFLLIRLLISGGFTAFVGALVVMLIPSVQEKVFVSQL